MRERSGSTGIIGVIVGAAIVIAIAFFLINGNYPGGSGGGVSSTNVTVEAPKPAPATPSPTVPAPTIPAPAAPAR